MTDHHRHRPPMTVWSIAVETNYPWTERVEIRIQAAPAGVATLALREAGASWTINGEAVAVDEQLGYLHLQRPWRAGDVVAADLPLPIQRVRAHPDLTAAAGRIALQRGPVVYALEEVDHGSGLATIGVRRTAKLEATYDAALLDGVMVISGEAEREPATTTLYRSDAPVERERLTLRAIPYAWWAHRGEGEMRIWIRDYES